MENLKLLFFNGNVSTKMECESNCTKTIINKQLEFKLIWASFFAYAKKNSLHYQVEHHAKRWIKLNFSAFNPAEHLRPDVFDRITPRQTILNQLFIGNLVVVWFNFSIDLLALNFQRKISIMCNFPTSFSASLWKKVRKRNSSVGANGTHLK